MITQPSAGYAPEVTPKAMLHGEWYWWVLPNHEHGFHKWCLVKYSNSHRPTIRIMDDCGVPEESYYLSNVHKDSKFYGPLPKPPKQ